MKSVNTLNIWIAAQYELKMETMVLFFIIFFKNGQLCHILYIFDVVECYRNGPAHNWMKHREKESEREK